MTILMAGKNCHHVIIINYQKLINSGAWAMLEVATTAIVVFGYSTAFVAIAIAALVAFGAMLGAITYAINVVAFNYFIADSVNLKILYRDLMLKIID